MYLAVNPQCILDIIYVLLKKHLKTLYIFSIRNIKKTWIFISYILVYVYLYSIRNMIDCLKLEKWFMSVTLQ